EDEGDSALVTVLDEMPAKDLVSILREFDSGKESVVNLLVTPIQFARAVVLESKFAEKTHDRLQAMVNSVIFARPDDAEAYLARLVETPEGCSTLCDYFEAHLEQFLCFALHGTFVPENYPDIPEESTYLACLLKQVADIDIHQFDDNADDSPALKRSEIADGTWMETAWVLRYEVPDGFGAVFHMMHLRVLKRIEAATVAATQPAAQEGDAGEESAI
ncbi:MAG: hypothetical protein ABI190_10155, partial [Casimicrobiaceae bacterium]